MKIVSNETEGKRQGRKEEEGNAEEINVLRNQMLITSRKKKKSIWRQVFLTETTIYHLKKRKNHPSKRFKISFVHKIDCSKACSRRGWRRGEIY